jgi:hypothetical protein
LMTQGGLKKEKFASRLVCFGVDQSIPSKAWDLELQFKSNGMAHQRNLEVQTLSNLFLVFHIIEGFVMFVCLFPHSSKRHLTIDKYHEN